jgi:ATPase subunit of ABC transporter with duplicated ATPase domains
MNAPLERTDTDRRIAERRDSATLDAQPALQKRTLRANDLHKAYKKRRILEGVSISVDSGDIVGLLGPTRGFGIQTTHRRTEHHIHSRNSS